MRSRSIVALVVVLGALSAPSAAVAGISVTRAELNGTALRVEGSGAVPNSTITVSSPQQSVTGRADATGAFRIQQDPFTSSTCGVTVSDGSTSATAKLSGCTPSQPPPPPGAPVLSALTLSPASVAGGTTSAGTVSLSAAAQAATTVALSSSNVNVAAVPASVTIAAGATSASFAVTTATAVPASTTVTITASSGGVTQSAALTVTGSPLAISTAGLTCTNGVCELGPGNVGTFFYVAISFNPEEVADNMKKYGGFIPGIRAGRPTAEYLSYVLNRITWPGSLYLGLIALVPTMALAGFGGANQNFPFGGTSILIIVGVGLETVKQIESQLQQRNYEGFLR